MRTRVFSGASSRINDFGVFLQTSEKTVMKSAVQRGGCSMWPGQTQQSLANRSIVVLRGMTSVPLSQLPPADDRRNGDAHVSQVGRRQAVKAHEGEAQKIGKKYFCATIMQNSDIFRAKSCKIREFSCA